MVSPVGCGAEASWQALIAGANGARRITEFELQFEEGYDEARKWLEDGEVRDELDHLCRQSRTKKAA